MKVLWVFFLAGTVLYLCISILLILEVHRSFLPSILLILSSPFVAVGVFRRQHSNLLFIKKKDKNIQLETAIGYSDLILLISLPILFASVHSVDDHIIEPIGLSLIILFCITSLAIVSGIVVLAKESEYLRFTIEKEDEPEPEQKMDWATRRLMRLYEHLLYKSSKEIVYQERIRKMNYLLLYILCWLFLGISFCCKLRLIY